MLHAAKGNAREILELVPNVGMYMDKPFEPEELLKNIKKLLLSQAKTTS